METSAVLVAGPVQEKMPAALRAWSDAESFRQMILTLRDKLRSSFCDDETVKRMRRSPDTEVAAWLSTAGAMKFVYQSIKRMGVSDECALLLATQPSVIAAFMASMAALAVHWLAFGGLEAASPDNVRNDLHDVEYAVLGSLSVGLVSADKRLQNVYAAVSASQVSRRDWLTNTAPRLA